MAFRASRFAVVLVLGLSGLSVGALSIRAPRAAAAGSRAFASDARLLTPNPSATPAPLSMYFAGSYCYDSCEVMLVALTPSTNQKVFIQNSIGGSSFYGDLSLTVGGRTLFANDGLSNITEYTIGNIAPVLLFHDPGLLMAASTSSVLYIAHGDGINVYAPGASQPERTIVQGITNVVALAVRRDGHLFVSNGNNVVVYAPNTSSPSRTITAGIDDATLLAFDKAGQLIVYSAGSQSVEIYAPNGTVPTRKILGVPSASWIVAGPTNTLYVVQHNAHQVSEFDHEGVQLSRTITSILEPVIPVVDAQDALYVLSSGRRGVVRKFRSGSVRASAEWPLGFPIRQTAWTAGTAW